MKGVCNKFYFLKVDCKFFISDFFFLFLKVDGKYRQQWDDYVLQLDVVDSDKQTSTDLVHWVTKCPYPFSTREYIYLRRSRVFILVFFLEYS